MNRTSFYQRKALSVILMIVREQRGLINFIDHFYADVLP